ncbi:LysR family transcriptional regulator [Rhodobacteraceae bacterium M382]|nr:LysR family transcriptional regulator [Rhodobacteraceae bacterium M382]
MPRDTNISLKQLQALEAVTRYGSFTLAAKHLRVSQPSVSSLIGSLEKQFKCRFFERNGNEIVPTQALEEIRGKMNAIVQLQAELENQLARKMTLDIGSLNIGYTTHQLAMPIVSQFVRQFPGVEVTARTMATNDLMPLLNNGTFDVAFITRNEPPTDLHFVPVAPTRIGIIAPADHPLAEKETLNWNDIVGLELIQREPSSETRRSFEAAARIVSVQLNTLLGLGSWGSIMTLVRSGLGVGVGFEREFVNEAGLVFLPIDDKNLKVTHYLTCLPAMRYTATVSEFLRVTEELM